MCIGMKLLHIEPQFGLYIEFKGGIHSSVPGGQVLSLKLIFNKFRCEGWISLFTLSYVMLGGSIQQKWTG